MSSEASNSDTETLVNNPSPRETVDGADEPVEVNSRGSSIVSGELIVHRDPGRFTFDLIRRVGYSYTDLVEDFNHVETDDSVSDSLERFWYQPFMLDNLRNNSDPYATFKAISKILNLECEEGRSFALSDSPLHAGQDENLGHVTPGLTFTDASLPTCVCNFVEPDGFPDIIKNPMTGELEDGMVDPVKNTVIDILGARVKLGMLTNRKSFIFIKLLDDDVYYEQYFRELSNGRKELVPGGTLSIPFRYNVLPDLSSRLTIDQGVYNFLGRSMVEGALQPESLMYHSMAKALEPGMVPIPEEIPEETRPTRDMGLRGSFFSF